MSGLERLRRVLRVETLALVLLFGAVGCDRKGESRGENADLRPTESPPQKGFDAVAEGLESPCGVTVQPGTGHVFVSMKDRIVRFVPGDPYVRSDEVTGFTTDTYRPVPVKFGPLGLAFLAKDVLVVGDGSLPDGEELVRFYEVGSTPLPGGKAIKVGATKYSSGPVPDGNDSKGGEGNFYGIAVRGSSIFVTSHGDDTKGWISRIDLVENKPGSLIPFIKGKVETEVDAPASAVITPDGKLLVSQLGELNLRADSVLTFYDPDTGKLERKLETGLRDLIAVAYSPKSGDLYGLDFSWAAPREGKLCRLTIEDGKVRTEKILDLDKPTAMVFAPDGTLYVTLIGTAREGKAGGKLLRVDGL